MGLSGCLSEHGQRRVILRRSVEHRLPESCDRPPPLLQAKRAGRGWGV